MIKFQKIFFICLFSYILSLTVTKIEPTTVTLGEEVTFTLTVEDYDSSSSIYLGDIYYKNQIYMSCTSQSETSLTCSSMIYLLNQRYLNNLSKSLYVNGEKTDFTVSVNIPSSIKLINFEKNNYYYTYGVSSFRFEVNYNELYNSSVSIKFGDVSITKCEPELGSINFMNCYCEFPESSNGKTLVLTFNNQNTEYSIEIKTPNEFSNIDYLYEDVYYSSSSAQFLYFYVDSSYKMNEHSIVLVSDSSTNPNITLTNCSYYYEGIRYAKCSGTLNKVGAYYVFVDNENKSQKIFVYPEPIAIPAVYDILPYRVLVSPTETIFTLRFEIVVNLEKTVLTLVDKYISDSKIELKKCSKIEGINNQITCSANVTNSGLYLVHLDGVRDDEDVLIYSSFLTKSLYIVPNLIKFESATASKNIEIYFDSINDISSKIITLKGNNNNIAILELDQLYTLSANYYATFPAPDTYYVYINDVKQNASITVTNEILTSKAISIFPNTIAIRQQIRFFTLTVDSNTGIELADINLFCIADSLDKTKAICSNIYNTEGEFFVNVNGVEFNNVKITVKKTPYLYNYTPLSIFSSSISQTITFNFKEDVSNYVNKASFYGNETIQTTCQALSKYSLSCSAVFNKVGNYYFTIDDAFNDVVIYVTDNTKENNQSSSNEEKNNEDPSNQINDDNNSNYFCNIKIISMFLIVILII